MPDVQKKVTFEENACHAGSLKEPTALFPLYPQRYLPALWVPGIDFRPRAWL